MKPQGYSRAQIGLHWVVAILVFAQFVFHDEIVAVWTAFTEGKNPEVSVIAWAHVWGGTVVLLLGIWRLVLRIKRGAPPLPEEEHLVLKGVAHVTHWVLYTLIIMMPITGLATWFGNIEFANTLHSVLKIPLLIFVLLHFLGALFQHFYLRTGILTRMFRAEP